ncbi:Tyrosine-protein kinase ptk [Planctomycetes bacterium Pan216]|uniref:Tyrosine-protein kinase ptk n=1 Tax=Kolteria novifilia TaxID=2527975 RepID=A0A518B885_9BACT|nr:Tyrosine-protein kinase ptk [Planctomycetes bacterium Pan216]
MSVITSSTETPSDDWRQRLDQLRDYAWPHAKPHWEPIHAGKTPETPEVPSHDPETAEITLAITPPSRPEPAVVVEPILRPATSNPLGSMVATESRVRPSTMLRSAMVPPIVRRILREYAPQWRSLTRCLERGCAADAVRTLIVSGTRRRTGSTSVAIALSWALVHHTGRNVLLMDADFSQPSLADRLQLPRRAGLERLVESSCPLRDALIGLDDPPITLLTLGKRLESPSQLIGEPRWWNTMAQLRQQFDLVVMDVGALLDEPNPALSVPSIDAALLVSRPSKQSGSCLSESLQSLKRRRVRCLGVIENGISM